MVKLKFKGEMKLMIALRLLRRTQEKQGKIYRDIKDIHIHAPKKLHKEAIKSLGTVNFMTFNQEPYAHYVAWKRC